MDLKSKYDQLENYNKKAELGGGQERINKQHEVGKKTARERILQFFGSRYFYRNR